MKRAIVLAVAVLALPTSVALAAKPSHPAKGGKSNPMVMYVLKGMLTSYTPATADQDGSVTIDVRHSNFHSSLKGQSMTFDTTMKTRITFPNGATTLTAPAKGVLKFKAPLHRKGDTTLVTTLTTNAKALHVIDQAHQ
ncbi:MAG TPA: hypothetical protein VGM45_02825 [Gaiellaceae bacterium]|jgi:hypothetical protein